jgi:hypothetical protein
MIDRDVVNVFHYLRWKVKIVWIEAQPWLFCPDDTPKDAEPYLTRKKDQLRAPLRLFIRDVDEQLRYFPKPDFMFGYPLDAPLRQPGDQRPCFVAMPYGEDWFESVKQTILNAGKAKRFDCVVSLDMSTAGQIVEQIWQQLRRAEVVVADLTNGNPNVYYEVGLAHALGKEIIFITQDQNELPFDLSKSRCIRYEEDKLVYLRKELKKAFAAVKQRYDFDPEPLK